MAPPVATVVIVTRDRRDELRVALRSATGQDGDVEVLVMDDGSKDGTAEMVTAEFPDVRLVRSETSLGYIRQRNRAANLATAPIVVSIDDDAELSSPSTVAATVADFSHPRIGAVAIPVVHTGRGEPEAQRAPRPDGVWLTRWGIGTAHAVRRDLFLSLGGYREQFERYGLEESDLGMRLLGAGHVVRLGRADPVLHHDSPRRDSARNHRNLCRNQVLQTWFNVPFPHVLRALAVPGYALVLGMRTGTVGAALAGVADGLRDALRHREQRAPLPREVYRLYARLKRRPLTLETAEEHLPPARETAS